MGMDAKDFKMMMEQSPDEASNYLKSRNYQEYSITVKA